MLCKCCCSVYSDIYFSLDRLCLLIITLIVVMLALCCCCTWSQCAFLMEKGGKTSCQKKKQSGSPHSRWSSFWYLGRTSCGSFRSRSLYRLGEAVLLLQIGVQRRQLFEAHRSVSAARTRRRYHNVFMIVTPSWSF